MKKVPALLKYNVRLSIDDISRVENNNKRPGGRFCDPFYLHVLKM